MQGKNALFASLKASRNIKEEYREGLSWGLIKDQ